MTSSPLGQLPCFPLLQFTIVQSRAMGIADHILPLGVLFLHSILDRSSILHSPHHFPFSYHLSSRIPLSSTLNPTRYSPLFSFLLYRSPLPSFLLYLPFFHSPLSHLCFLHYSSPRPFLGATKHLYNWLCPLVGWLVGWSVGWLVGP